MILIIFFCKPNILLLLGKLPTKITPYLIIERKQKKGNCLSVLVLLMWIIKLHNKILLA